MFDQRRYLGRFQRQFFRVLSPVTAIAIAWILRHTAGIQPVVGTMNVTHLNEICEASGIRLTRKEWYDIYISAGNKLP